MMCVAWANTANVVWAANSNTTVDKAAVNPFEDKNIKTMLTTYLKPDFKSKAYGDAVNWTLWFSPYKTINNHAIRLQMVGKEDNLAFVNIELYSKDNKPSKDFDTAFAYVQNIYNKMFPQWAKDDFLQKNFATLTKNNSFITVTRDNIVFEFSYFESSKLKQVIIRPKH
jgi:hypothetical protein